MDIPYATRRRQHARHNEEVYTHIRDETKFTDWLITTAFYTAVHYVESFLFPFEDFDDTVIESIHDYHKGNNFSSLHVSRDQLVKSRMSDVHGSYKRLQDLSKTSRYKEYEFTTHDSYSILTDQKLDAIKEFINDAEE